MKKLIIGLLFLSVNLFGQTHWYQIKENKNSDVLHKKYKCYIEIDTEIIKDPKNAIVHYNNELLKPEGNKFYILSMAANLEIKLTEKGNAEFEQYKKHLSTNDFNRIHLADFYKIYAKHDSVYIGDDYKEGYIAYIVIDTNKIKYFKKISVLLNGGATSRIKNTFDISFRPAFPGYMDYNIAIINNETIPADTIKFTHSVYGMWPPKKKKP